MSLVGAIKAAVAQGIEVHFIPGEHGVVTIVATLQPPEDDETWADGFHCAIGIPHFQAEHGEILAAALVRASVDVRQAQMAAIPKEKRDG